MLNKEIETMSRKFKKVQGVTIGVKEITLKTFYKNGKKVKEKSINHTMNKIEVYGFENLKELKVLLAHEIGHLVGIPHINKANALMNPILQENQKEKLLLTNDDIKNFKNNF
jgi:predicted Zn-dependent protease